MPKAKAKAKGGKGKDDKGKGKDKGGKGEKGKGKGKEGRPKLTPEEKEQIPCRNVKVDGRCDFGDACAFRHDQADVGVIAYDAERPLLANECCYTATEVDGPDSDDCYVTLPCFDFAVPGVGAQKLRTADK